MRIHNDELLVVIAIIAILAALLLPTLSAAKARAQRTVCMNNVRQINLGVRMYADDHDNVLALVSTNTSADVWTDYKSWMKSYVGLNGASSPQDTLFACPADTFRYTDAYAGSYVSESIHLQLHYNYSSYFFNAGHPQGHRNAFISRYCRTQIDFDNKSLKNNSR